MKFKEILLVCICQLPQVSMVASMFYVISRASRIDNLLVECVSGSCYVHDDASMQYCIKHGREWDLANLCTPSKDGVVEHNNNTVFGDFKDNA